MTCINSIAALRIKGRSAAHAEQWGDAPRLTRVPNIERRGKGTTTFVLPRSAKYTISRGIDAMIGIGSLWRQRISKTSSRKPSKVAVNRDSKDER